jgi:hypothetical protein
MVSLTYICIDEIFPLWSLTDPAVGGIGFRSAHIGIATAICGATLIVFQLFIYPRMAKKFGSTNCFRIGNCIAIVTLASYPLLNLLTFSTMALWMGVSVILIGRAIIGKSLHFTIEY